MDTNPTIPDWYVLMREWLLQGMGNTGITLPFLAGALAFKQGETTASADQLRKLIEEIISNPVSGYFVGVRLCGNIHAPVLSVLPLNDTLLKKCVAQAPDGQIAFAFSPDAMSVHGGLNCDCTKNCIEKLIQDSSSHTEAGNFSRNYNMKSQSYIYSTFSPHEVDFIMRTIVKAD